MHLVRMQWAAKREGSLGWVRGGIRKGFTEEEALELESGMLR